MYGMFLFGCFLLQGVNGTKLGFEHTNFIHGHYHGHYLQLLPVHLLGGSELDLWGNTAIAWEAKF